MYALRRPQGTDVPPFSFEHESLDYSLDMLPTRGVGGVVRAPSSTLCTRSLEQAAETF